MKQVHKTQKSIQITLLLLKKEAKGLARFENPSSIDDSYVKDGHLIKSVTNPSTYITPNNGDWTNIPEDTNLDKKNIFPLC